MTLQRKLRKHLIVISTLLAVMISVVIIVFVDNDLKQANNERTMIIRGILRFNKQLMMRDLQFEDFTIFNTRLELIEASHRDLDLRIRAAGINGHISYGQSLSPDEIAKRVYTSQNISVGADREAIIEMSAKPVRLSDLKILNFIVPLMVILALFWFSILIYSKKFLLKNVESPIEQIILLIQSLRNSSEFKYSWTIEEFDRLAAHIRKSSEDTEKHYLASLEWKTKEAKLRIEHDLAKQVAHDIRSPVSALRSATYMMSEKPEEATTLIKLATDRIDRIASDLLITSKNDGLKFNNVEITINETINQIVSEKRIEFEQNSDLIISEIIDENKRAVLCAKEIDLKRVISNLINNSIEASNGKNHIRVATIISQSHTDITIRDEGSGIPDALLTELNLKELHAPITTKSSGHGLGIYAAKKAIQNSGGSIKIQSKLGVGTSIDIRIPTRLQA